MQRINKSQKRTYIFQSQSVLYQLSKSRSSSHALIRLIQRTRRSDSSKKTRNIETIWSFREHLSKSTSIFLLLILRTLSKKERNKNLIMFQSKDILIGRQIHSVFPYHITISKVGCFFHINLIRKGSHCNFIPFTFGMKIK